MGGHNVPEETIRRRYTSGLKNFFRLYEPLADSWQMYDNTKASKPKKIALKTNNSIAVFNQAIWQNLTEKYNEFSK